MMTDKEIADALIREIDESLFPCTVQSPFTNTVKTASNALLTFEALQEAMREIERVTPVRETPNHFVVGERLYHMLHAHLLPLGEESRVRLDTSMGPDTGEARNVYGRRLFLLVLCNGELLKVQPPESW